MIKSRVDFGGECAGILRFNYEGSSKKFHFIIIQSMAPSAEEKENNSVREWVCVRLSDSLWLLFELIIRFCGSFLKYTPALGSWLVDRPHEACLNVYKWDDEISIGNRAWTAIPNMVEDGMPWKRNAFEIKGSWEMKGKIICIWPRPRCPALKSNFAEMRNIGSLKNQLFH